jgi:hypothetical protein
MKRGRRPKANPSKWGLYKRIKRREEKLAQRDPDEVTREIYQFGELFNDIMIDHILKRHPHAWAQAQKQAMQSWLETLQRQEEIKREHQRPF